MDQIKHWIDLILHADTALFNIVREYKTGTYLILMIIIFCETGLVITPFLPGDSLLFVAGAIAGASTSDVAGVLSVPLLVLLLFVAAFAGDNSNYFIGKFLGHKVFNMNIRFLNKEYLQRTHNFYEKHGGKTIIIARFMPIIRTFAPFVAGIGEMMYSKFIFFSIIGNMIWINLFLWAGYMLGENKIVKEHFGLVTLGIIGVSLLPAIYGVIKGIMAKKK